MNYISVKNPWYVCFSSLKQVKSNVLHHKKRSSDVEKIDEMFYLQLLILAEEYDDKRMKNYIFNCRKISSQWYI